MIVNLAILFHDIGKGETYIPRKEHKGRVRIERSLFMSNSQMIGIRILCMTLGWAFGAIIFGTEAVWLFDFPSYIWCGMAGGAIGILLTTK